MYMDDEMERKEYVLADSGLIWVGSAKRHRGIPWTFGQVENRRHTKERKKDVGQYS